MSARRAASSAFRALSGSRATTTRGRDLATSPTDARASASATPRVNTVDPRETAKFEADAALWWDEERGPFAPLHAMNPVRCEFVRDVLVRHFRGRERGSPSHHAPRASHRPLAGLRLLDVGCGGGILCEALARMGADVVGVDAAPGNVAVAEAHASLDPAVAANLLPRRTRRDAPRDGRNLRRGAVVGGDRTRGGPGGVRAVPGGTRETRRRGDFLHHQSHG